MSSSNQAAIANLLSQSLQTVQQQLLTNSNILSATNAVVQTNTTAIVSNSVAINASSTDIQEINSDISAVNQAITNLAIKEQNDIDDLQEQINDNLIQLETLEEKEEQDVININASIASLQLAINQNTSDIVAVKNTDITFTNEFITVSNELHELAETHASDTALLQGQITTNLSTLNALETKEANDVATLTTQLSEANAIIATHTQNITALFSEDLSFSTDFTNISDSLDAQIAKEASDVADINNILSSHSTHLSALDVSFNTIDDSLSDQIDKQASDLTATNSSLNSLDSRLTALSIKETNDVSRIDSDLASQLSSINTTSSVLTALTAKQTLDYNTHQTHLTNIDSSISTLNNNVFENTNDIGTLTNQLTTIVGGINTNVINLSSLESTISSTASSVSSMQSQISTIQQQANLPFETAHEWAQQQTFLVPPVMSGANIQAATIPKTAIDGSFVDTDSVQTINGIKTFSQAPVFSSGLSVSGSVSFPNSSIPASAISGLSSGVSLSDANTWTGQQTFQQPPIMSGARISEYSLSPDALKLDVWQSIPTFSNAIVRDGLGVRGQCTIGENSANTLTVNSTATFQQPPVMSGASITANTIPPAAINGGINVSLPTAERILAVSKGEQTMAPAPAATAN